MIMQLIKSETYHINNKYMKKGETMQNKWQLDNGVRIVTEKFPFSLGISGLWFSVGSVYENEEDNGMSHLEHILFMTKTRTAKRNRSGYGFGRWPVKCIYCKGVHLLLQQCDGIYTAGPDILSDMVMNSIMDPC